MKARNANRTAAAAAMALLAMTVCGSAQAAGDSKANNLEWQMAQKLTSTTVAKGQRSAYSRPVLLVAQNSCQWKAAMAALAASNSLDSGAQPEPDGVDWKHQSAVVVAMGQVPYGYSMDVREARETMGKLLLDVQVDYQSYENNLDDATPVVVLLVNGHGMSKVQALYELDVPGLVKQNSAASCGAERGAPGLSGSDGNENPTLTMTWGSLKSTYR